MVPSFEIPTFTVTINPLESNEMTFVPSSPPEIRKNSNGLNVKDPRLIANMTVIVDDEVKSNLLMLNNGTNSQVVKQKGLY